MYNEILKIIEGGIDKDRNKVISYSKLLSENLQKDGDEKFANKIQDILNKKTITPAYLDSFLSTPVDQETRLSMVDVLMPNEKVDLVLSSYIENEIDEFILSIKKRNELMKLGVEFNSSLLLYGPPGTGKTSLAHMISYKTNLPLVIVRLDSLVSSLLGNTAKNIRKIFEFANNRPCILFLDEFDAIAKARDDNKELGELKRVINSLLQNIDEFNKNNILIAATNHHEMLDPAIWRRFPTTIEVMLPGEDEIIHLLRQYLKDVNLDFKGNDKKLKSLAQAMEGMSPADIKSVSTNVIRKSIINDEKLVQYDNFVFEIYVYLNHNIKNIEDAVKFFSKHGITQRKIYKMLNIPFRQVGEILSNKK